MPRRFVLLLPLLLLLTTPARGQEPFKPVKDAYLARIFDDHSEADRIGLVDKVAAFDSRDAAKVLLGSMEQLSEKLDEFLERLAKLEEAHDKVNTNLDRHRERRDELRGRLGELDKLLSAERAVHGRILRDVTGFKSENAQAVVVLMAKKSKVWRQRGIAARAAAQYTGDAGRKAALKALEDKEPRVVVHTLIGLRERRDSMTIEGIAECLQHEVWMVKSAAADALAAIGSKKAIRPLIEALATADGRVQDDINDALMALTGEKFAPDYETWKDWYEKHRAELEEEEKKPLARGEQKKGEGTNYYGIRTRSKRIVYLIDVSGSMNKEISGADVTPEAGEEPRPSGPKIEIAKFELKNAIRQLPDDAYFNIIVFNHIVRRWEKEMVKASQKNNNKAYLYIRRLKAAGSTYTFGALREAFKLAGMGARDPDYRSLVDTIFVLSDGAPTDQTFPTSKAMDPDIVLKAVKEWNNLGKVVIHAIAIDPGTQGGNFIKFMKQLAEQNGGQYTERG